jgi:hypothetical protein
MHLDFENIICLGDFFLDFFLSFFFLESNRSNLPVLGLLVDDSSSNILCVEISIFIFLHLD